MCMILPGNFQEMSGRYPGNVREVFGKFPAWACQDASLAQAVCALHNTEPKAQSISALAMPALWKAPAKDVETEEYNENYK